MCPAQKVYTFLILFGVSTLVSVGEGAYQRRQASSKCDPFCENVSDYPLEKVRTAMRASGKKYQHFLRVTPKYDDKRRADDVHPLCHVRDEVLYPQKGINVAGETVYIVNDGKQFQQGVRVTKCLNPWESCQFSQAFPYPYKTSCQQQYITQLMLIMKNNGQLQGSEFKLPACCDCKVLK